MKKEKDKVHNVKISDREIIVPPNGVTTHHSCEKSLFVDVDKTLVFFEIPKDKESEAIDFSSFGFEKRIRPHWKHVEFIKEFKVRGIGVFVWSAGGPRWAAAVVERLGLTGWVDAVLPKPDWYLDDKDCKTWMGERCYFDIDSGEDLVKKEDTNVPT